MKLIIVPGQYSGYLLKDIEGELGDAAFADFQRWFSGQTGAIHEGELLIYQWDYEQWLRGLQPLD